MVFKKDNLIEKEISREEKYLIEKEIEYLSHLQEKNKFYSNAYQNSINNKIMFVGIIYIALFIGGIELFFSVSIFWGLFIIFFSFIVMVIGLLESNSDSKNLEIIKKNYASRELEIKEMYKKLGVNIK